MPLNGIPIAPWTNPGVRLRRVITGSARPLAGHDSLPNLLPLAIGLLGLLVTKVLMN